MSFKFFEDSISKLSPPIELYMHVLQDKKLKHIGK